MRLPGSIKTGLGIWLEKGGREVFCDEQMDIFLSVRRTKSISAAAEEMGISYRAAWGKIKRAEDRLGFRIVQPLPEGEGRGTALTAKGGDFISKFEKFYNRANKAAQKEYKKIFGRKK